MLPSDRAIRCVVGVLTTISRASAFRVYCLLGILGGLMACSQGTCELGKYPGEGVRLVFNEEEFPDLSTYLYAGGEEFVDDALHVRLEVNDHSRIAYLYDDTALIGVGVKVELSENSDGQIEATAMIGVITSMSNADPSHCGSEQYRSI